MLKFQNSLRNLEYFGLEEGGNFGNVDFLANALIPSKKNNFCTTGRGLASPDPVPVPGDRI